MTAFDPARHYLIARDRETGEHVHVPLPDLVREVRTIEVRGGGYDDTAVRSELVSLEGRISEAVARLNQAVAMVKQHEADISRLLDICRQLDGRISSVSLTEAA